MIFLNSCKLQSPHPLSKHFFCKVGGEDFTIFSNIIMTSLQPLTKFKISTLSVYIKHALHMNHLCNVHFFMFSYINDLIKRQHVNLKLMLVDMQLFTVHVEIQLSWLCLSWHANVHFTHLHKHLTPTSFLYCYLPKFLNLT